MGEELFSRSRYAEAQKTFETALRELEKSSQTDLQRLQSMNSLAMAFQQQGLLSQADVKYAQALELSEKYPEHDLAAKVSNNLAMLRSTQGRFAEAEALYLRALVIQKKLYGDRNAAVAITLDNLAMLQVSLGRYAEAEKNLLHALDVSQKD